ncbi:MAG: PIN domain nuclease [Chloroflexota bacterium]
MILVDSTVWIDYFNGVVTPETDYLDAILSEQLILVGDIILAEVLQGFHSDSDFEQARLSLGKFQQAHMLNPELAIQSAQNYRTLRKRGITIRKTIDCFIATYCIHTGQDLLHTDSDFDPFEDHLGLRVIHPTTQ